MRRFQVLAVLALSIALQGCSTPVTIQQFMVKDQQAVPLALERMDPSGDLARRGARLTAVDLPLDGNAIGKGVHLQVPDSRATVVFFGGNAYRIRDAGPKLLQWFAQLGVDVLWVDYRGIGATEGEPSMANMKADAKAVVRYAAALQKPVLVHGFSMGSVVASSLAGEPEVAALVLEGGISTAEAITGNMQPWWSKPFVWLELDDALRGIDNRQSLASYRKPLLLLVGSADRATPLSDSRALLAAAGTADKTLVVIDGAVHGNALKFDAAQDAYRQFIARTAVRP